MSKVAVNVKSVFKHTWKQDIDMEPLDSTNIGSFTKFKHKFATWLNEWVLLGKRGLTKQTFSSCLQTSQSFPPLIQHLLKSKRLYYLLTGNIQSEIKST